MEHLVKQALERIVVKTPVKHIIFDFDNTLYDTERRKDFFWEIAGVHGYSKVDAYRMYNEARMSGDTITISLESYLGVLQSNLKQDKKKFRTAAVQEILNAMDEGVNLLPGAKQLLEWCLEKECARYLLSLGVREWQEMKYEQSGLAPYFSPEHVVFTENAKWGKREAMNKLFGGMFDGTGAILVNDKPDETRELLVLFPKMKALVRREKRDKRYQKKNYESLVADFPGRVAWAENLSELQTLFVTYF